MGLAHCEHKWETVLVNEITSDWQTSLLKKFKVEFLLPILKLFFYIMIFKSKGGYILGALGNSESSTSVLFKVHVTYLIYMTPRCMVITLGGDMKLFPFWMSWQKIDIVTLPFQTKDLASFDRAGCLHSLSFLFVT